MRFLWSKYCKNISKTLDVIRIFYFWAPFNDNTARLIRGSLSKRAVSRSTFPHGDKLVNKYMHLNRFSEIELISKCIPPFPLNLPWFQEIVFALKLSQVIRWRQPRYKPKNSPNLPHQYPKVARPPKISSATRVLSIEPSGTNFS